MKVHPIRTGETNIMYLVEGGNGELALIDPADPIEIEKAVQKICPRPSSIIVLTTHHHSDHSAGNASVKEMFPSCEIYAGSARAFHTKICQDGEVIRMGGVAIRCIHTPCHTMDSFSFYFEHSGERAVFTGDTLFYLGCGRFTEGTAEMMEASLRKIASLPPETKAYYGHDYRESNMRFRRTLSEDPEACHPEAGIFLTVEQEKEHNLFVNTERLSARAEFAELSPTERLSLVRRMKDAFNVQDSAAAHGRAAAHK
ncbi:hydroxyacylglutathione hydrolase [Nematocida major]|uniref:hydroxyacylglutathione hydrolase n=1 Tax=Nematocida major TaxID=1912982 RepID=UPI0020075FFA|nr:hydroxyacylglutathione hydrolase [Nematocida major]KAH9385771.1 hydroxyacylglutathione hydrolase [Nematocida major]